MKKEGKYIIGAVCLMILVIILSGCGKEQDVSDSQPAGAISGDLPEGYAFFTHFEDAGREAEMHGACLVGGALYYYSNVYDAERGGLVQDVYVQEKGELPRQLLNFGYGDGKALRAMAVGEDGSLYLLYGEGAKEDGSRSYILEKRNRELKVVYSVDTTEGMEEILSIYDMEVRADGTLYGITLDGTVLCWDGTGMYQGRFTMPKSIKTANGLGVMNAPQIMCFGLVNAGPSGVYAYWAGEDNEAEEASGISVQLFNMGEWEEMDEAERGTAEPLRVDFKSAEVSVIPGDDGTFFVFSGYEGGLYMADQYRLWGIGLEDGSLKLLLAWEEIGLKPWYVRETRRQEGGGFLMYVFDTLEEENYWVTMDLVPASALPEKHELVLGVAGGLEYSKSLTIKIDQVVLSYNRTHPYSHVTVREYGRGGTMSFQMQLLTGEGPDILLEMQSYFDMETLVGKGIVEDLAPYIAESEEELLPGILELATKGGKIPRIPLSFSVDVMILPEGMGQEVMTPQELVEFIAEGEYIDYFVSEYILMDILPGAEMDRYVDKEKKSCSFDSEEFVSLLESLARLRGMERMDIWGKRAELFRSGQLRVIVEEMDCMKDYFCFREAFSEAGEIVGFPNSSGELRYPANLYDWMGINSATEYKEDAWGFIEFCLSYMSRSDNVEDRFVATKDKFYQQTYFEKAVSYSIVSFFNKFDENWGGRHTVAPLPQEETDMLWEITEHLYFYEDNDLMKVIQEEAGAFFSGDISAKEAAKRIQSRASLIVNE